MVSGSKESIIPEESESVSRELNAMDTILLCRDLLSCVIARCRNPAKACA